MAEKLEVIEGGKDKKEKRPPKTHNLPELIKKLGPFTKEIFEAYELMEEDHGSHVLTINNKFEAIAEKIGFPQKLIRSQIAKMRRAKKDDAAIKEMEEAEIEQEIELAKGFEGTAFGAFAKDRLAKLLAAKKAE